jgi:hypothetical protein
VNEVDPVTQLCEAPRRSHKCRGPNQIARLDPILMAHGLMCQAMQILLGVNVNRADDLARVLWACVCRSGTIREGSEGGHRARAITGGSRDPEFRSSIVALNRVHRARLLILWGQASYRRCPSLGSSGCLLKRQSRHQHRDRWRLCDRWELGAENQPAQEF